MINFKKQHSNVRERRVNLITLLCNENFPTNLLQKNNTELKLVMLKPKQSGEGKTFNISSHMTAQLKIFFHARFST